MIFGDHSSRVIGAKTGLYKEADTLEKGVYACCHWGGETIDWKYTIATCLISVRKVGLEFRQLIHNKE